MIGPHVFGDGRFGLWVINPIYLGDRLPKLRSRLPWITDIFLPETAGASHKALVREHGLFCHVWSAIWGRSPIDFANDALAAHGRIGAGAIELNFETAGLLDSDLKAYIKSTMSVVRKKKPRVPVRINTPPFKAQFLPDIVSDPNLYVIQQAYFGNMDGRASEFDCLMDMIEWGIPVDRCSVQYAASCEDLWTPQSGRVPALPAPIRGLRRGSIFQDDLLFDVGILQ